MSNPERCMPVSTSLYNVEQILEGEGGNRDTRRTDHSIRFSQINRESYLNAPSARKTEAVAGRGRGADDSYDEETEARSRRLSNDMLQQID